MPAIISSSLESVSTCSSEFLLNQMFQLFDYVPRLKYLDVHIRSVYEDFTPSPIFSLMSLNLSVADLSDDWIIILLQNLPNLRHLNVGLLSAHYTSHFIYGNHWEDFIRNYLPKLKESQFDINVTFSHLENIENEFNQLFWYVNAIF
ncbi:unnamed protein product [Rotaria magnacalcarata]